MRIPSSPSRRLFFFHRSSALTSSASDSATASGVSATSDAAAPPAPDEAATIVLQVQPTSAQVFVDGEFVGTVDDLQSAVTVAPGVHRVAFRAPGFDPIVVDIRVAPGGRITYR